MKLSRSYQWSVGVDCPGVCGTFEAEGVEDWRTVEKIVSQIKGGGNGMEGFDISGRRPTEAMICNEASNSELTSRRTHDYLDR